MSFIFVVLTFIFYYTAKSKIHENQNKWKGEKLANAGLILAIIYFGLWALAFIRDVFARLG